MMEPRSYHGDRRHPTFDLSPDEFRAMGHRLVDRLAALLAETPHLPLAMDTTPGTVRALLTADAPLPIEGSDAAEVLDRATTLLVKHGTRIGHPRFFGYVVAPPAPLGVLAEMLAAAVAQNVGAWALSPVTTEVERQTVRWIAELVGYATDCGGLLVSGGNMANLVCCVAASRNRAGWDLRREGTAGGPPLVMYASAEAHTWIQKAADLMGLGTGAIRYVAVDGSYRMDPDVLRGLIRTDRAEGRRPFLVAATAGTVSTGAVDPLEDLARICSEDGLWLHVDGAYGAPGALMSHPPRDLQALRCADSLAIDPHKWLYAPVEAGCVLVRDASALHCAFRYDPPYYRFGGAPDDPPLNNFHEWGPQNSRGFRALKVWLTMQQAGRNGFAAMIDEDVRMARRLYSYAEAHSELQALTCGLSITTFRYVPVRLAHRLGEIDAEAEMNDLNTRILDRVQRGGEAYLSNAVLAGGRFALRACIVNFRTTAADVASVAELVVRTGRELDYAA